MKRPKVFQGEKILNTNKNYFEGWYFKQSNSKENISFIPGISINDMERKAFIQVITDDNSYFADYDIDEFEYSYEPFYVKIGNNYFSEDSIHIDINDRKDNLTIFGDIKYTNNINIKTNALNPNIMGPFSYVWFMECNHAILSMKNRVNGELLINQNEMFFDDGIGYI